MTSTLERKTEQEKNTATKDISMENQGDIPYEEKLRRYEEFIGDAKSMGKLLQWAYNQVGHKQDAEDVLQKSLIRAYKTLPRFRFQCSLSTRMYAVVKSEANHMYRKRKVRHYNQKIPLSHTDNFNDTQEGNTEWILEGPRSSEPDYLADLHEENKIVEKELKKISKLHLETLKLRREGHDYETIAEKNGIKLGTVKSRILRGRKDLLERLRRKGIEVNSN